MFSLHQVVKAQETLCAKFFDGKLHTFVYTQVDEMPEFPGGIAKFYRFISDVPLSNKNNESLQSTIFPSFVIDTTGNIKNIGIKDKLPKDYTALDRNMITLLKKCPKWIPAKCNGKKVAMRYQSRVTLCYTN